MTSGLSIRIHANDNVVIARRQLLGGTLLADEGVTVAGLVPPGHKVATRAIAAGQAVRRYDQVIGSATQASPPPSKASCVTTAAWPRATTSVC